jgi:Tfp pilus assembly protein FimT
MKKFPAKRTTPRNTKSYFTLMELLAVITITSILLTIAMRAMKVDSTKASASTLGGVLSFAQSYAYTSLATTDSDTSGKPDEYVQIIINGIDGTITVAKRNDTNAAINVILREETIVAGSEFKLEDASGNPTDTLNIGFRNTGEPIYTDTVTAPSALTGNGAIVQITDKKNPANYLEVTLKPFTGKVTYY